MSFWNPENYVAQDRETTHKITLCNHIAHGMWKSTEDNVAMSEDTLTKLQKIVGLQLGLEPSKVRKEAKFSKELGADSLKFKNEICDNKLKF